MTATICRLVNGEVIGIDRGVKLLVTRSANQSGDLRSDGQLLQPCSPPACSERGLSASGTIRPGTHLVDSVSGLEVACIGGSADTISFGERPLSIRAADRRDVGVIVDDKETVRE